MASAGTFTNETLLAKVAQIQALITHCTNTLNSSTTSTTSPPPSADSVNPLALLRDAAKLLRAHATKVGLLLINDPFTPSAVQKELTACETGCIPGLLSAVEVCYPAVWTHTLAKEVHLRVDAAMGAVRLLLQDVESKALGQAVKLDAARRKEKTLASTGQLWEACDELMTLEKLGIAGCVAKKAQEYCDMLKDAIEELKDWGEDEEDQDEGFVGSDDEAGGDKDSIEDMFSGSRLPAHRKDIKELLEAALKKLKLVDMLFQALMKRRVKTLGPFLPETVEPYRIRRADDLVARLKQTSEAVDELASAFYELNAEQVQAHLDNIVSNAQSLASGMMKSWSGSDDEFTTWASKWTNAIGKKTDEKQKAKVP